MTGLLYKIYNGDYDITPKQDKTQQELCKKLYAEWDKIQETLGGEFADHILGLEGELEDWRAFHYYREGFRLGVRLMMEVLTSATG